MTFSGSPLIPHHEAPYVEERLPVSDLAPITPDWGVPPLPLLPKGPVL